MAAAGFGTTTAGASSNSTEWVSGRYIGGGRRYRFGLIGAPNHRETKRGFVERGERSGRLPKAGDDVGQHGREPVRMM